MADPIKDYRIANAKAEYRRETAELCLRYPRYSLEEADALPVGDRKLLLRYARIHDAEQMMNLMAAIGSAQSKKGASKLETTLKDVINKLTKEL